MIIRFQAFWTNQPIIEDINVNMKVGELEKHLSNKYFKQVTIEYMSGIPINKTSYIKDLYIKDKLLKLSERKVVVQPIIDNEKLDYTLDAALDSSIEETIAFIIQDKNLDNIVKVEVYNQKQLLTDDSRIQFINLGNYDQFDIYITTSNRKLTAIQTLEQFKVFQEFTIFFDIEGNYVCYKFFKPFAQGILYKHKGKQSYYQGQSIKLNDHISLTLLPGGFRIYWNNNTTSSVRISLQGQ